VVYNFQPSSRRQSSLNIVNQHISVQRLSPAHSSAVLLIKCISEPPREVYPSVNQLNCRFEFLSRDIHSKFPQKPLRARFLNARSIPYAPRMCRALKRSKPAHKLFIPKAFRIQFQSLRLIPQPERGNHMFGYLFFCTLSAFIVALTPQASPLSRLSHLNIYL
jgi:hypothetical protein